MNTTQPHRERPPAADWLVAGVLLAVVAIWGAAFSGIKILLRDLTPAGLTSARLLVAAATFTALLPLAPGERPPRERGDVTRLLLAGVAGSAGYHLALNWGEQFVTAGLASLLVAAMPAMVASGELALGRERPSAVRLGGIVVAFGGVALLAAASGTGLSASRLSGILVTLLAPAAWTVYTIAAKPLARRYDGVRLNLVGAWAGALVVLPLGGADLGSLGHIGAGGWIWLLFLGALSQAAAYVAYAWALRSWSASAVSGVVYLVPVSSLVWAWVLLGEVPSAWTIAGGALILGGVVAVQRAR